MAKLLIVEDDLKTNEAICEYLIPAGHKVIPAYDGAEAIQLFQHENIDLVVLDIMLPHISGLSVLHEIRQMSQIPVLMLTALEDEYTQVMSFDEQADDYMTKPFEMLELLVRIDKVLKRNSAYDMDIHIRDVVIHTEKRTVTKNGKEIYLKPKEFDCLMMLALNKNK